MDGAAWTAQEHASESLGSTRTLRELYDEYRLPYFIERASNQPASPIAGAAAKGRVLEVVKSSGINL